MTDQPPTGLWPKLRGLVFYGWAVAALRLALDALAGTTGSEAWATAAWCVGLYWLMPPMLVWHGIARGPLSTLTWPRLALAMLLLGVLVWGLPNLVAYGTAQFQEWTHGRFYPGEKVVVEPGAGAPDAPPEVTWNEKGARTAPPGETVGEKVGASLLVACLTALAGGIWSLLWATGTIWWPAMARRKRGGVRT